MRRLLNLLLVVVLLYGAFIAYKNGLLGKINFWSKPCSSPIAYTIGTFDTRFGLSKTDFLKDIDRGAQIWQKAINKKLFQYDATGHSGDLVINLIYDSRQKITDQNSVLESSIDQTKQVADSVKQQYSELKQQYAQLQADYIAAKSKFEQNQQIYNDQVQYWNERGGAPPDEYQKLLEQKQTLFSEQNTLEQKRLAVNSIANQINQLIDKYNLLVQKVNANVSVVNENSGNGKEFDEGLYISDNSGQRIEIYQFSNQDKLIRVLAHELGHALGLDHNNNPNSIMYRLNQSSAEHVSAQDLSSLKTLCGIK